VGLLKGDVAIFSASHLISPNPPQAGEDPQNPSENGPRMDNHLDIRVQSSTAADPKPSGQLLMAGLGVGHSSQAGPREVQGVFRRPREKSRSPQTTTYHVRFHDDHKTNHESPIHAYNLSWPTTERMFGCTPQACDVECACRTNGARLQVPEVEQKYSLECGLY
jgi:hypothetical protein